MANSQRLQRWFPLLGLPVHESQLGLDTTVRSRHHCGGTSDRALEVVGLETGVASRIFPTRHTDWNGDEVLAPFTGRLVNRQSPLFRGSVLSGDDPNHRMPCL